MLNKNNGGIKYMKKVNVILEGYCKGNELFHFSRDNFVSQIGCGEPLKPPYVTNYTVIDETNKDQYSVWKGALGVALLGGFGAVAGIGGKKKKEYLIAIEWKDGEKSLICLDDDAYKTFVRSMF